MKKLAILAVAVAMVAAGIGFSTKGASAAAPVASTGGPYAALVGQGIQFNGSGSAGTGGLSYYWNFGDGTATTGVAPVKAYYAAGVYTVTLTVQDAFGATASATTTATIGGFASSVVSSGCFQTASGAIVCTTLSPFGSVVPFGCVVTIFGVSCPGRVIVQPSVGVVAVDPAICSPQLRLINVLPRNC